MALSPLVLVLSLALPAQSSTITPSEDASDDDSSAILGVSIASAAMTAFVLGVGTQAWWDEGLQPFSLRETGFFGQNTYAGGADKLGHMYAAYVTVHIAASIYSAIGVKHDTATWLSGGFTFALFNGFELIDGFTQYGFEYGDVIMNSLGIGVGMATRLSPTVDSIFGMRLGYWPSRDFLANPKSMLKLINDYTGMLFYFDLKPKGIIEALGHDPGLARFLIGGLAYGTQSYSPVRVFKLRRRSLGFHLGVSVPELLRAAAGGDSGMLGVARFFDFYAMPFFSILVMHDLDRGSWYLSFGLGNRLEVGS